MAKSSLTYVSLFSGAGLGCYGFSTAGFNCVATAELIPRRLEVQRCNKVCDDESCYYLGDLSKPDFVKQIIADVNKRTNDLTLVVATPPCQGMSVANHKKKDELPRNSLVVQSLCFIENTLPKFFLLENVRGFLNAACKDHDDSVKPIREAIKDHLNGHYNIVMKVVNLKDVGSPSSRTRTLVIGVRKDIKDVTPYDFFPSKKEPPTLRELIGHLPRLHEMGEISDEDIYHAFRSYNPRMRPWIHNITEGQSAFDNTDPKLRPHRIINGKRVENKATNGDKYRRNIWDKAAPCIHTRNDILASQATVHPEDDRVFSIRELCLMMGVPKSFKWSPFSDDELNRLPLDAKKAYIQEHDINIRQCLGEGVPTPVFSDIAKKIKDFLTGKHKSAYAKKIYEYEMSNPRRKELAAYYTSQEVVYSLLDLIPELNHKNLRILEPSVGAGAFLDVLMKKYEAKSTELDLVDVDEDVCRYLTETINRINKTANLKAQVIDADFLEWEPDKKYHLVIGNPPFGKSAKQYGKFGLKNLYAKFLEKALDVGEIVAFVIPKSFLSGKEYKKLRDYIAAKYHIVAVEDYGETAFRDIKIETIGIVISKSSRGKRQTVITSRLFNTRRIVPQEYLTDEKYPCWLLYRNDYFDKMSEQMHLGIFDVYRDRKITKKHMKDHGSIQLIKARNIKNGFLEKSNLYCEKEDIPSTFYKKVSDSTVIVVPNLSYYPRATMMPENSYPDGSAAALILRNDDLEIDLDFFSSPDFFYYYRIARNYSVRSLNIDSVSCFFWGIPDDNFSSVLGKTNPRTLNSKVLFHRPVL